MAPDTSPDGGEAVHVPKPPTERGWAPIGRADVEVSVAGTGHAHRVPDATVYLGPLGVASRLVAEIRHDRDVDRTFENEMRLQ